MMDEERKPGPSTNCQVCTDIMVFIDFKVDAEVWQCPTCGTVEEF